MKRGLELATETSKNTESANHALWIGIGFSLLFTALIAWINPRLENIRLLPDGGASWYYWKLPEPSTITRISAWGSYLVHQLGLWGLIYYAQTNKHKYSGQLHRVNWLALGWNAFFILWHIVQTHLWYDGLAQDVSIWSSQVSVVILLIWVLILENPRRGVFFGKKAPLSKRIVGFARKYHGYYFAWAIIYTFWYHPTVSTPGHLWGFFYMFLLLLQSSLFLTRVHVNRIWTFVLELTVLAHGTLVAINQGMDLWPMFFFGFAGIFIVTQMYGLGLSHKQRLSLIALYVLGVIGVYSSRGVGRLYELVAIPLIDYLGLFVLAGILWPFAAWLDRRKANSPTN
jgi:hypothetical protein